MFFLLLDVCFFKWWVGVVEIKYIWIGTAVSQGSDWGGRGAGGGYLGGGSDDT
jgi:hypothetical protein